MKLARVICFLVVTTLFSAELSSAVLALPPSTADVTQPNIPSDLTSSKRGEMPLEFFNYLKDCFVVNVKDGQQQFAAWLPLKTFLRMYEAGGGNGNQLEAKIDDLKPYLMFMVENRTTDKFHNPTSESAESLRSRARLRLPDGSETKPVDRTPDGMPSTPPSFGTLGRRGQLLIFPVGDYTADLDSDKAPRGKLELVLQPNDTFRESSFTWHLPLELAGNAKQCTKCHNDLSGKWLYCPFCGTKQK